MAVVFSIYHTWRASSLATGPHFGRELTANHAYLRIHGHNYDIWYRGEKKDDHRLDRYNYLYKEEQLETWIPRIKEAELQAAKVRIFFNSHARAKSVRNAFGLNPCW